MTFDDIFSNIIPNREETVRRFSGNLDLLEKFVRKFPQDENWLAFQEASARDDFSNMEMIAHTLKGYAGNIGFKKLYEACTEIVNYIRADDIDKAKEFIPAALEAGKEVEGYIAKLD